MPPRTSIFRQVPWVGGINTSVDPAVLNPQELVTADDVVFSATGARIKREALEYLDHDITAPDLRSSSGTTRTLKWTTTSLVNITNPDERLVVDEQINVSSSLHADYAASDVPVISRTEIPEVSGVTCIADVSNSLRGKYFLFSAGDEGTNYYVWYKVNSIGTDPAVTNRTGIEVDISTGATASTVASTTASAINAAASADVTASAVSAQLTLTNTIGGLTQSGAAGTSGFAFSVTTKGGHSITYEGSSSLTESETAAGDITIERASEIISFTDYWRFNSGNGANEQIGVYATDDFQLFTIDLSNRRVQILGQGQVTQIACNAASTLTTGDYWTLNGPSDATNYYVWYNVDSGGGDPLVPNRTGVQVSVLSTDTDSQVASKTVTSLLAHTIPASAATNTVTVTFDEPGTASPAVDVSTGFTITTPTYGATAPATRVEMITTLVYNNQLLMAFSGLGNRMIFYDPGVSDKYQLKPNAPDMSVIWEYQSRVFGNDKTDPDRMNYSPPFDSDTWGGYGDSGALFVGAGDGDPVGIINGYSYKGLMVVSKLHHKYRMVGDAPETYIFQLITEGLGSEGPMFIPVDEQDVVFMSHRGIHSQATTDQYGDTTSSYLSAKIKPTFNTWSPQLLKFSQGAWIPELNSFAISVAEQGNSTPNAVWLYNVQVQAPGQQDTGAWYRWPNISCTALSRRYINSKYKLVFGTKNGRLIQAQKENSFTDFATDGIPYRVKTGTIYVDNDPQTLKAYKKLSLLYRPKGNFTFNVTIKIDNFPAQAFAFNQISGLDLLGETFILGSSLLGSSATLAPFTFSMDGVGRGFTMEITQPSAEEQIEVWGYMVEWEPAGTAQEVV